MKWLFLQTWVLLLVSFLIGALVTWLATRPRKKAGAAAPADASVAAPAESSADLALQQVGSGATAADARTTVGSDRSVDSPTSAGSGDRPLGSVVSTDGPGRTAAPAGRSAEPAAPTDGPTRSAASADSPPAPAGGSVDPVRSAAPAGRSVDPAVSVTGPAAASASAGRSVGPAVSAGPAVPAGGSAGSAASADRPVRSAAPVAGPVRSAGGPPFVARSGRVVVHDLDDGPDLDTPAFGFPAPIRRPAPGSAPPVRSMNSTPRSTGHDRTTATSSSRTAARPQRRDAASDGFAGSADDTVIIDADVAAGRPAAKAQAAVPSPYPGGVLPLTGGAAPSADFVIKGNIDSMLYHDRTSPSYRQTVAEVWFRDSDDAEDAGFRPWNWRARTTGNFPKLGADGLPVAGSTLSPTDAAALAAVTGRSATPTPDTDSTPASSDGPDPAAAPPATNGDATTGPAPLTADGPAADLGSAVTAAEPPAAGGPATDAARLSTSGDPAVDSAEAPAAGGLATGSAAQPAAGGPAVDTVPSADSLATDAGESPAGGPDAAPTVDVPAADPGRTMTSTGDEATDAPVGGTVWPSEDDPDDSETVAAAPGAHDDDAAALASADAPTAETVSVDATVTDTAADVDDTKASVSGATDVSDATEAQRTGAARPGALGMIAGVDTDESDAHPGSTNGSGPQAATANGQDEGHDEPSSAPHSAMQGLATPDLTEPEAKQEAQPTPASPYGPGSVLPTSDGSAPSDEYRIKGNADSMLYHTTDSPYYGRTRPVAWFRTEEDAQRAGFSAWNRRARQTARAMLKPAFEEGRHPGSARPGKDGGAPTAEFTVKADEDSMLYHTKASPVFGVTVAEVWFRSEADAQRAGFTAWHAAAHTS